MARYPHQGTTKDGGGRVICSASVAVFLTGTSTPASIYVASAGGTAVNSVTSGADTSSAPGYFIFYVDRTDYGADQEFDITISKSGFNNQTYPFIVIDNADDYLPFGYLSLPSAHKTSHQLGGVDEISVAGLPGVLVDDQHVLDTEVRALLPWVDAKGYGAVGNGTTDDSAAILAAATSLGATGGTVYLPPPGKYLIDTNLSLPANVTLKGPFSFVGSTDATDYGNMSALIINSARTITLGAGSGIEGCLIYRKGITFPTTGAEDFAGTAITYGGDDCFVFNSIIMGFNKLIYSTGRQRPHVFNVQGDGINGIEIINCTAIAYLQTVHLWPFSIYPNDGNYKRSGTAFKFSSIGDWNKATDCFSYGYYRGFHVHSCNNVTLLGCGADGHVEHVGSIGFEISGTSYATKLIGCQGAGQYNSAYHINTSAGQNTQLIACDSWGNTEHCILVDGGDVSITGGHLFATPNGITVNNATSKVLIDQVKNSCTVKIQNLLENPNIVQGFVDNGTGWEFLAGAGGGTFLGLSDTPATFVGQAGKVPAVNVGETALIFVPQGEGGAGTPGGLNTHVQYNDNTVFGGDEHLTWNKTSKLLAAYQIGSRGVSITGTAGTSGNTLYINGETTFSGKLIVGAFNGVDKFWFDITGGLELSSGLTLANSKAISGRNTSGTAKDLIYIGGDDKLKIGDATLPIHFVAGFSGILKGTSGVVSGIALPGDPTKFLDGNGAFNVPSGGTPGGSTTQVQFNDAGVLAGDSDLTWNKTTNTLTALGMASRGLSLTGTAGTSGNTLYINGESTFTGNLIVGALNSVEKFKVDKDGNLTLSGTVDGRDISADLNQAVKTTSSPTFAAAIFSGGCAIQSDGAIVLNNNRQLFGKDTVGTSRGLIGLLADNVIYVGYGPQNINIGYGATSANPIYIRVGGATKNVTIDASGFLKGA